MEETRGHEHETEPADDSPQARILDAAERLFMEEGFAAVSLRQIAEVAGLRQATLYYYFPEGKEALYVAMAERFFARQQAALTATIGKAGQNLASQVAAVFRWLGSTRPEVHYMGMMYVDMPALHPERAAQVGQIVYRAMFSPLANMFAAAIARGEARPAPPEFLAGALLALADGITFSMKQSHTVPRAVMEQEMARLVLEGVLNLQNVD